MTPPEVRALVLELIEEARAAGARFAPCCACLGLVPRTVQRWRQNPEDGRATAVRPPSANALTPEERAEVMRVACSPAFRDKPPAQIVAGLADNGKYLASERTFYRILRAERLLRHRTNARPPVHQKPFEKIADGPNQVWSWDITYLRGPGRREFYYLYVILDVWSRKIVAAVVHEVEQGHLAAYLFQQAFRREGSPNGLVLHSDRGAPMTSASLLGLLEHLHVRPSVSRPRVSDDNPFSEALFRTVKYRPSYPSRPFNSLAEARAWVEHFVRWYNHEHRHSGIGMVTPSQRHSGEDVAILERRRAVYAAARAARPERWAGPTRAWARPEEVALNPSDATRQRLSENGATRQLC